MSSVECRVLSVECRVSSSACLLVGVQYFLSGRVLGLGLMVEC